MAELKLSTVWKIKDYAKRSARIKSDNDVCEFTSKPLPDLEKWWLPRVKWYAQLYRSGRQMEFRKEGFAGFYLNAMFESSDNKYVWAYLTAALVDVDKRSISMAKFDADHDVLEFSSEKGKFNGHGEPDAFKIEDVQKAIQEDGSLSIRIDLTLVDVLAMLRSRKLLRGLLANNTMADFEVKVGGECFKLHKCVLAEASPYFSGLLQSGMKEAAEGVLTLPDTPPAAFRAFSQAIYYDNWDFRSDIDLTLEVMYLAEKFQVEHLKNHCDDSLADKVNQSNELAIEILTKSAAVCSAVAEKTKSACIKSLVTQLAFKESQAWLDFQERNPPMALEILDAVKSLEAENADLKRKRQKAKARRSSNKRRRK